MYGQDYSGGHVPQDETPLELSEGYQTNEQVTAYTGSSGIVDSGTGVYYDSNASAYTTGFIAPSQQQIYSDVPSTRPFDDIYTQSTQTGPRHTAHTSLAYGQEVPPFHDPNGPPRYYDLSSRSLSANGFAAPFNTYPNPTPPTEGYHSSYTGNTLLPTGTTRTNRSREQTYCSSFALPLEGTPSAYQPQHIQGWDNPPWDLGASEESRQSQLAHSLGSYDERSLPNGSRSDTSMSSRLDTSSKPHRVSKSNTRPLLAPKPPAWKTVEAKARSYRERRQPPKPDVGDRETVLGNFSSQLTADRKFGNAEPRKLRITIEEGAPDERLKYLGFLPRYRKKATGAWCWRPEKAAYIGTQLSAERELCPFCFQNDGNLYAESTYDDPTSCDCDNTNPFKTTNEIWS